MQKYERQTQPIYQVREEKSFMSTYQKCCRIHDRSKHFQYDFSFYNAGELFHFTKRNKIQREDQKLPPPQANHTHTNTHTQREKEIGKTHI
jgi:hypothetical protein